MNQVCGAEIFYFFVVVAGLDAEGEGQVSLACSLSADEYDIFKFAQVLAFEKFEHQIFIQIWNLLELKSVESFQHGKFSFAQSLFSVASLAAVNL